MSLWPRKINIQDVLTNSLGWLIAWFIWSMIILIIIFIASWAINLDVKWEFDNSSLWLGTNWMFPFILSFITFLATTTTLIATYFILNVTDPERYKRSPVILWQIGFFWIFTYFFITPLYIFTWLQSYDYIMIIFICHCLLLTFWTSIILEILNNYRYILTSIYWSFLWFFITIMISIAIFYSLPWWYARLLSLLVLLPLINTSTIFFKWLFEMTYYYYNKYTNLDQLWDIFIQIEEEAKERIREEIEKSSI